MVAMVTKTYWDKYFVLRQIRTNVNMLTTLAQSNEIYIGGYGDYSFSFGTISKLKIVCKFHLHVQNYIQMYLSSAHKAW